MAVSNQERDHMPAAAAVHHVFKVNFLSKWQCQRLYADNHEVMMNLKCGANLKEARKGEYRFSMWSSSRTLPFSVELSRSLSEFSIQKVVSDRKGTIIRFSRLCFNRSMVNNSTNDLI